MVSPSIDPSAKRVWALLLACSALYFFSINEADNDLWGHVLAGRDILARGSIPRIDPYSYTASGQPWVNHEWLAQVVLAYIFGALGSPGLLLLKVTVAAATCGALIASLRLRTLAPPVWGAVGLLAIAVLARGFAIRPQIFTYCGIAVVLALLDHYTRGRRHVLLWLPPLFALWANVHGGFVLALGIVGFFVAADLLFAVSRSLQPAAVLVASVALTAVNPWGFHILRYIADELRRPHPITEWQAVSTSDASQFAFLAMLVLLLLSAPFARQWRTQGWRVLLALGVGFFALRHQRHTPVFALCAVAPLAAQVPEAVQWLRGHVAFALSPAARRLIGLALIGLAIVQCTVIAVRLQRDGLQIVFDPDEYPVAAVEAMRRAGAIGNLAVPLDWGAYVLWFLSPRVKVSLDGRFATVFPERVVEDNFDFYSGASGWRRMLEQYPTEAALVPAESPCPIGTLPDWQVVFQSRVARVYARTGSPSWPALQQFSNVSMVPNGAGVFP